MILLLRFALFSSTHCAPFAPNPQVSQVFFVLPQFFIIFLASFFQGLTGFGFGIISVSLLALVMEPKQATILCTCLAFINVSQVLWSVRKQIRMDRLWPLAAGALLSMPLAVKLFKELSQTAIIRSIGVVLIATAVRELTKSNSAKRSLSRMWGFLAGIVAGFTGGLTSMSGPPVIAYCYMQDWDTREIKAMLQSLFMVTILSRLALITYEGLMSRDLLTNCALLAPVAILGSQAGIRLFSKLKTDALLLVARISILLLGVYLLFFK